MSPNSRSAAAICYMTWYRARDPDRKAGPARYTATMLSPAVTLHCRNMVSGALFAGGFFHCGRSITGISPNYSIFSPPPLLIKKYFIEEPLSRQDFIYIRNSIYIRTNILSVEKLCFSLFSHLFLNFSMHKTGMLFPTFSHVI